MDHKNKLENYRNRTQGLGEHLLEGVQHKEILMSQKIVPHKSAMSAVFNSHGKTLSSKQLPQIKCTSKTFNTLQTALSNFEKMPDIGNVRIWVVMALLGVSASSVWRLVSAGKLRSYKLTPRTTTFNVGEIRALLAAKGAE